MEARNNLSLLRKLLGAIGLSPEAVDDIIERISDLLFDKGASRATGISIGFERR